MGKKVGVIDLGSNSIRLLIAWTDFKMTLSVKKKLIETRLGEGLRSGQKLSLEARQRTFHSICDLVGLLEEEKVDEGLIVATSAVREAADGPQFIEEIIKKVPFPVNVLSQREEAYYGFKGVEFALKERTHLAYDGNRCEQFMVLDLGGRSTELSWEEAGSFFYVSFPFGAVSLHEKFFKNSINSPNLLEEFRAYLMDHLAWSGTKNNSCTSKELVGIGGTVTTLAALEAGLKEYDPGLIHGSLLYRERLQKWEKYFLTSSLQERRHLISFAPQRADIITAGASALLVIMKFLLKDYLRVSEEGLLWGVVLSMFQADRHV